jgi:signal transduction histidine kinase
MASTQEWLAPVTPKWPIQAALALVVILFAGQIVVDLVIARKVAEKTTLIVENTQRSIELLEDLHSETYRLSRESDTLGIAKVTQRLARIASEYDPIANQRGEHAEWLRLSSTIERMRAAVAAGHTDELRELSDEIDQRIDQLVTINRTAAHANADQITAAHHQAIVADGSIGAVVLVLCVGVAFVLRRLVSRQRELLAAHIALLGERNRELDLFAARAAHDLRSPLSPIRGYADLLSSGAESADEVQRMASRIRSAVDKMARVVDDMLDLSRAGRPQPGRASPRAVGAEVVDELEAELRGVQVEMALPEDAVACAPGVLQQILRNLVENAVKFRARDRALIVHLSGRRLPALNGGPARVELSVEDNGVGMDAELAAHAFEPFQRGRTDREVPGHGLGLAIVDRAAQALGGEISLEAAPNRGCRFTLVLPAAPPA